MIPSLQYLKNYKQAKAKYTTDLFQNVLLSDLSKELITTDLFKGLSAFFRDCLIQQGEVQTYEVKEVFQELSDQPI